MNGTAIFFWIGLAGLLCVSLVLGRWHAETRAVRSDYARAVGEPPDRIVAVWLIAVSLFQKGHGAAEFSDVWIESGGRRVQVL